MLKSHQQCRIRRKTGVKSYPRKVENRGGFHVESDVEKLKEKNGKKVINRSQRQITELSIKTGGKRTPARSRGCWAEACFQPINTPYCCCFYSFIFIYLFISKEIIW